MTARSRARQLLARHVEIPAARLLRAAHLTPNAVTLLGLLLAFGAGFLAARGLLVGAALLLLASGACDLLDGALARLRGGGTPFGALLDSAADRVGEAAILVGLVAYFHDRGNGAGVLLACVVLVSSFLVSYLRARSEGLGFPGEPGWMTRPERVLVLVAGLLVHQVLIIALAFVAALSTVTVGQRLLHVWRQTR